MVKCLQMLRFGVGGVGVPQNYTHAVTPLWTQPSHKTFSIFEQGNNKLHSKAALVKNNNRKILGRSSHAGLMKNWHTILSLFSISDSFVPAVKHIYKQWKTLITETSTSSYYLALFMVWVFWATFLLESGNIVLVKFMYQSLSQLGSVICAPSIRSCGRLSSRDTKNPSVPSAECF